MIKTIARQLFQACGYRVTRLQPRPQGPLHFGPFTIETDSSELVAAYREYPEMNATLGRLVSMIAEEPPASMIDIGANCGDSVAIAKRASLEMEILCIEGDQHLSSLLALNAKQFSGVTIKNSYLGEEKGQITVSIDKSGWNNTLTPTIDKGEKIFVERLDDVIATWPALSRLRLIKCDTEGYDTRIFFGGRATLSEYQPVLFFEYNRHAMRDIGEEGLRIFSLLAEVGYHRLAFYDSRGRFLLASDVLHQDVLKDLHDYADGFNGEVYYYDIVAFSRRDDALAMDFVNAERIYRNRLSGPKCFFRTI
jgi:FkbM family methyltransferase